MEGFWNASSWFGSNEPGAYSAWEAAQQQQQPGDAQAAQQAAYA